jgi:hypothetical protein
MFFGHVGTIGVVSSSSFHVLSMLGNSVLPPHER